jgi:hypothetical protein
VRTLTVVSVLVGGALGGLAVPARAQDDAPACPLHAAHQAAAQAGTAGHHEQVDQRHDDATGVAHMDSVHHFDLGPRGGSIRLEVTDPADTGGRDRIRTHLGLIAAEFAQGRFDLPMMIHDQTPPGVETMRRLKSAIRYRYSALPRGGRVEISTDNAEARQAIHDFLRFQIDEHRTGDPHDPPAR